ncbi:MAG: peptidoglycan DD-metalloendopeptidase family protein, partial [Kofleriaceae bacterium]
FFLRRLLAEARPQGGGLVDGGFAGDTFKQMLDEAVADKVASAGGLGMADMFAAQLGGKGAISATAAASGLPAPHQVASFTGELGDEIAGMPRFAMPVPGHVTSKYGPRVGHTGETHLHKGLDLSSKLGDPVAAAAAGTVTHAGPAGDYGNLVTVRHADGFETRYAHLSAIGVATGQAVEAGQALGQVGSTGLSDGPHLHFEVRQDGDAVNPSALLPLNRSGSRANR